LTSSPSLRLSLIAGREHAETQATSASRALQQQKGRDEAVTSLLEEHVDAVFRYALRLTRDAQRAWDLTQETMLRGWQRRRDLREPAAARVWLMRIATNLHRDQLRRPTPTGELLIEPTDGQAPTTLRMALHDDVKRALAALDELPPRQRQVMHLITVEKFSREQAADVLGISVEATKSSLAAARKTLRMKLKDVYDELRGMAHE